MSDKFTMFENRLMKVEKHLRKTARRQGITCFRLYDRDLPEFPLIIELYEDKVYVAEYQSDHKLDDDAYDAWLEESQQVIAKVLNVPRGDLYLRTRQRKQNRQSQYEKLDFSKEELIVQEDGLKFKVNLSDYLDSGLFLDHRITRHMVREEAKDKKVLNLFCYTGSFSVYAAAGGAASVTSIDLSKTYLAWAEENMRLNGLLDPDKHQYIHADVLQHLDELKTNTYDLVVLDPPTFSNSKRMKDFLDIQRDHVELVNKVLMTMKKDGVLYFSNNLRRFELDEPAIHASSIKNITAQTVPFDFQGKLLRHCFRIIK
ncbi:class I SAM-dependent methyltransferase [Chitinophaga sp. GCM10012297]|uniref:Class I SAM-dependent methyltransferase n=1 Tax=Chitinophaga chungangae TaxID=2821488 RepID=A0ABS3Y7R1_9BACT|nr:class I SAM-dependent methyltransferase [Chitinophaga chungangae]MBO9150708.1 class I SAM-dependent methyltransferase [Chitinophaga chungangae]